MMACLIAAPGVTAVWCCCLAQLYSVFVASSGAGPPRVARAGGSGQQWLLGDPGTQSGSWGTKPQKCLQSEERRCCYCGGLVGACGLDGAVGISGYWRSKSLDCECVRVLEWR